MENHSCVKIQVRPTDFKMGDGQIPSSVRVADGNWLPYIEFYERQLLNTGDSNGCVIFTFQESFDAQMNYLILTNKISEELLTLFNRLGYMDTNSLDGAAHFHTSPRFIQILTGNGLSGNNLVDAPDAARKYGMLPYKDLPVDPTMTPEQYVDASAITQAMYDKASQFLAAIGSKTAISYQWITSGGTNIYGMQQSLPTAPLALGVNVGSNWNVVDPPAPPVSAGGSPGHSVMNYMIDAQDGTWIYDHYLPNPKDLVAGYPIWYSLQTILTVPLVAPVLPSQPTVQQELTWLQQVSSFLTMILSIIKGRNLSSNQMNNAYSFSKADLIAVAKGLGIAVLGAALTYLTSYISNTNFGVYTPVVVAVFSVLVNAVRKFVANTAPADVNELPPPAPTS